MPFCHLNNHERFPTPNFLIHPLVMKWVGTLFDLGSPTLSPINERGMKHWMCCCGYAPVFLAEIQAATLFQRVGGAVRSNVWSQPICWPRSTWTYPEETRPQTLCTFQTWKQMICPNPESRIPDKCAILASEPCLVLRKARAEQTAIRILHKLSVQNIQFGSRWATGAEVWVLNIIRWKAGEI